MKKTSIASFVVGLVLIAFALGLLCLGITWTSGASYYTQVANGFRIITQTYHSTSLYIPGLAYIILGSTCLLSGVILLFLAAYLKPKKCCKENQNQQSCKVTEEKAKPVAEEKAKPATEPCKCEAEEPCQVTSAEQAPKDLE